MLAYDANCPHCGHRNMDMYLEETEGWMECEACGKLHQFTKFQRGVRIPVFRMEALPGDFFSAKSEKVGAAAI